MVGTVSSANIQSSIDSCASEIAALQEKIRRLSEASTSLSGSISELATYKSDVNSLTVDKSKWKGEKEDNFEMQYALYEESIQAYSTKTEEAKTEIDEEIKRLQARIAALQSSISRLESSLNAMSK